MINDKFGLEFDMLAARFDFSVSLKVPVPFNRYFKDKKKQEFKPVLFVGDTSRKNSCKYMLIL
jgi:hypothetical protein